MINKETVNTLYKRCENILANLAHADWWKVNKNSPRAKLGRWTPTGKERSWLPYSLSEETIEAREILQLVHEDMSQEDEAKIKGFIMRYRLTHIDWVESRP